MARLSFALPLRLQFRDDLCPSFSPAITADYVAQSQQRIDVCGRPMHASTFQPRFDHQFVRALDRTAANGPALRTEVRVSHVRQTLV
jgi:hypothetical protein